MRFEIKLFPIWCAIGIGLAGCTNLSANKRAIAAIPTNVPQIVMQTSRLDSKTESHLLTLDDVVEERSLSSDEKKFIEKSVHSNNIEQYTLSMSVLGHVTNGKDRKWAHLILSHEFSRPEMEDMKAVIIIALGKQGFKDCAPLIEPYLQNIDPQKSQAADKALTKMGYPHQNPMHVPRVHSKYD